MGEESKDMHGVPSDKFEIKSGLRQGDALLCVLFNVGLLVNQGKTEFMWN